MIEQNDLVLLTQHIEQTHIDLVTNNVIDQDGNLLIDLQELVELKEKHTMYMRQLWDKYQ